VLGVPIGASIAGMYYFVENAWWAENSTRFSFDDGSDLRYALNLDKAAHFVGGVFAAEQAFHILDWAGLRERDAFLWAAGFATFLQLLIEIKDGYSPYYGFSVYDLAAGAAGSMIPMAWRYLPPLDAFGFKFSYIQRSRTYFERETTSELWINDYENQTYWLTLNPAKLLGDRTPSFWPAALGIALGVSVDELDGMGGGHYELYLGIDVDLMSFVPAGTNDWWVHLLRVLNYYRLPLPALRLSPNPKILAFQ
jgi:hypothetical protein